MKPPSKNIREIEKISNYSKKKLGLKVVDIKNKKHLLALAPRIFELINISYSHLYSTVELSEKQIDYYTKEYFSVLNPKYIRLIENNNEEIIAFGVGLPSVAKAMQESGGKLFPFGFIKLLKAFKSPKRVELILIAVHPDYQKKGVNAIILDELIKSCNQYNIEEFDLNPQLATNTDVISQWDYFDIVQNKNRVSYYKDLK